MKLPAPHQPTGYVGRLQQSTLGWEVGRQIPRNGNEDMPALVAIAPLLELPHASLQHLIGVEPRILSEQCLPERCYYAAGAFRLSRHRDRR